MCEVYVCTVYRYPTPNMRYHRKALKDYVSGFIEINVEFTNLNNPEQAWARNKYLEQIPVGAYALILDSDEWLSGDYRVLSNLHHTLYSIRMGLNFIPRIIKKTEDYFWYNERHEQIRTSNYLIGLWHGNYAVLDGLYVVNEKDRTTKANIMFDDHIITQRTSMSCVVND